MIEDRKNDQRYKTQALQVLVSVPQKQKKSLFLSHHSHVRNSSQTRNREEFLQPEQQEVDQNAMQLQDMLGSD